MIALVDIGNSRVKYCFYNEGIRGQVYYVETNLIDELWLTKTFDKIYQMIVASVGHDDITNQLSLHCDKNNISYMQVCSEKMKNGVTSAYKDYEKLGVDRWLALLASAQLYPKKNILVIDAGTATTIDLLDAKGMHIGGWILAGINTLFTSVIKDTKKVQVDKINDTACFQFGVNTDQNVNNACWAATIGAIQLGISHATSINVSVEHVILTGGNAKSIESLLAGSLLNISCIRIDDLIFHGLEAYC